MEDDNKIINQQHFYILNIKNIFSSMFSSDLLVDILYDDDTQISENLEEINTWIEELLVDTNRLDIAAIQLRYSGYIRQVDRIKRLLPNIERRIISGNETIRAQTKNIFFLSDNTTMLMIDIKNNLDILKELLTTSVSNYPVAGPI
jgi:hypothetical protein